MTDSLKCNWVKRCVEFCHSWFINQRYEIGCSVYCIIRNTQYSAPHSAFILTPPSHLSSASVQAALVSGNRLRLTFSLMISRLKFSDRSCQNASPIRRNVPSYSSTPLTPFLSGLLPFAHPSYQWRCSRNQFPSRLKTFFLSFLPTLCIAFYSTLCFNVPSPASTLSRLLRNKPFLKFYRRYIN